jgi:flagellar hook-associated protein 3 FlgL
MRITGQILMNQALDAMRLTLSNLAKSQQRIATGRRLLSPSDDPAGHAGAVRVGAQLSRIEQWARQADEASSRFDTNDQVLRRLQDVVARASELAVSGADGAKGTAERAALAVEVNDLLEEVVDVANALDDGRYVLGGRETLTAPLTATRNAQGQITAATWNPRGVDGTITIEINEGISVQTNLGGTTVLGADTSPTFLPALLVTLRDRLAANDAEGVRASIDTLATAGQRIGTAVADSGARQRLVAQTQLALDEDRLSAQAALSAIVDADIARTATELGQQQIVYQAALQAAAKAIQPSLLDFLR